MKIAIWGVGAVGIGLASALARPGEKLQLIGRDPKTLETLADRGITREGKLGRRHVPADQLLLCPEARDLTHTSPDWLLVCTKAHASLEVARALEPLAQKIGPSTRLVLCQNGWGNEKPFLPFWPTERLFHGRVITGFIRRRLDVVEVTAHAAPIAFGSLFGHAHDDLLALAERCSDGGLPAEARDDMEAILWAKMLYNCALNPLGALTNRSYGELAHAEPTRALMARVVEEIFDVLFASGFRVAWPNAQAYLETFYAELIPPTAEHHSSMLQDLRAGRRTEIESLCGAVERLGREYGVETPVVSALARLVRAAETDRDASLTGAC